MILVSAALLEAMQIVSGPGRVELTIPAGDCRVEINGESLSLAQFQARAHSWQRAEPQVHVRPSPDAGYACVDHVLGILKAEQVTKLGFVGNEQYVPEKKQ